MGAELSSVLEGFSSLVEIAFCPGDRGQLSPVNLHRTLRVLANRSTTSLRTIRIYGTLEGAGWEDYDNSILPIHEILALPGFQRVSSLYITQLNISIVNRERIKNNFAIYAAPPRNLTVRL